ncbi:hypothetical protein KFZ76_06030 [Methylovulum psychrotolerans]|uniref:hypothetical protein n=1 Tax=Methylovulum psychrotolerans TaxID=1704499 RepID=UPI001BFFC045|nr:hypothetical protein [Methylovulum psychrotolerans]MBT9097265.1 hypothetical protein [Methylovulum psychrotolerans]
MSQTEAYSLGVKIAFWCLWSLCAVFLLPFAYIMIYMICASLIPMGIKHQFAINWPIGIWSLCLISAEIIILFRSVRQFLSKAKPASLLIKNMALTAFGAPFIAFGGCIIAG